MSSSAGSGAISMQQKSNGRPSPSFTAQSPVQSALGTTPGGTKITYTRAELLALSTSPISTSRAAHLSTAGLPAEISRSPVERKEVLAGLNGGADEGVGSGQISMPHLSEMREHSKTGQTSLQTAPMMEKRTTADEQFVMDP
ncbi:hypothetical protein BCV69DRAFT_299554 [Microstroma glucosiphilum]|uniref:Uncharacterized protein n=1 Tax=Pseudomicrostroma glucosiphilum TaxID=1684307 RepID=A0A316U591_9BASI|nr:hypothetical protein BCV69DRAFT_299554 [Pseudomicrostroma glucosiphilum]PWN20427.1 hypothetical protein BCV69DRAFT_299554 [Pseudomicrostroma glucosiphilum]